MSTRQLMNLALGTVTILLLVSVGIVVNSFGDQDAEKTQVELATNQQVLIQNLNQEVADLGSADNLLAVNQARSRLGRTIIQIDQTLAALVNGGQVEEPSGMTIAVAKVKNPDARAALEEGARTWIETGMPLADLAAGEFSIFSAAGKDAVAGLTQNSPALANQMGIAAAALQIAAQNQKSQAGYARYGVIGFGVLFGGLALARFRRQKPVAVKEPARQSVSATMAPAVQESSTVATASQPETVSAPVQTLNWDRHSDGTYTSPVDFDNVNASVDQMSVDMNTIAGSTDKMRLAIDSVGHALQGMLYSLNEMAQDTAEGYKIVRGANNAASYTADTASELAASAREMSRVVARVTQLATRTKQVAGQIDAEAVNTGSTGEAFTSVVAAEVKGLAQQTSTATDEIESTVAEILATARQYEEAIGQIIKNISAINKVSQNLGELMLQPPAAGVAGTPLPVAQAMPLDPGAVAQPSPPVPAAAPVAAPAVAPAPAPEPVAAVEPEDNFQPEPSVEEVAEQTSTAIEDVVEEAPKADEPETGGTSGNVFILGGGPKKPRKELTIPQAEPVAEPAPAAPVADTPKAEEKDDGSNIFMLNKPKKAEADKPAEPAPEVETPVAAEPAAAEPVAADPEPEAPAPAAPAPAAEVPEDAEPKDDGGGSNIFMLNKPKKAAADTPAAEPVAEAEEEPVTVPAEPEEPADEGGSNENIFMLNKPKK